MRVVIAAVGRGRGDPCQTLFRDYIERLAWPVRLVEVAAPGKAPPAKRRAAEAERLLAAVPRGAAVVALDARGRPLSSEAFAEAIAAWRDRGVPAIAFLVGGAEGLDAAVRERADLVLSLGPMTWPHMMVRAMLAEQLYRAQAILSGHPYHRG